MSLEQWSVGGRGFGALFVFLLMAGEIYTTFTFLGGSGWAYGKGGPAFYILCYGAIAYAISYFLLPVCGATHRASVHSQADFFTRSTKAPHSGCWSRSCAWRPSCLTWCSSSAASASSSRKPRTASISTPTAGVARDRGAGGLRDRLGVHGIGVDRGGEGRDDPRGGGGLGIYFPFHYYGGYRPMFEAIEAAKPGFLQLPAKGMSPSWFSSTVLLSAIGFYMWPHTFASSYTAKNESVFPQERGGDAALSARAAVRVLHTASPPSSRCRA